MTFLSLFAGIGGFDLGFERAGMRCVGQVEIDPFCRKVLAKHWPNVPRHDDICTFTGEGFERPDVICGGFPCQDISNAGKGAGIAEGTRSGLWSEYARIIRTLRPRYVVVENVAALLRRGIGRVLGDLAGIGYDAEWFMQTAAGFGAPHKRERIFIVANNNENEYRGRIFTDCKNTRNQFWDATKDIKTWQRRFDELDAMGVGIRHNSYANARGILDGIPNRMDRVGACGNAVVPQIAEWIGRRLMQSNEKPRMGHF